MSSEELTISEQQPSTIRVKLGNAIEELNLEFLDLTSMEIAQALHFTNEQVMFCKIVSLIDTNDNTKVYTFQTLADRAENPFLSSEQVSQLRSDTIYEVKTDDLRKYTVQQLTQEEIDCLRLEFNKFDLDSDGSITVDEIRIYFTELARRQVNEGLQTLFDTHTCPLSFSTSPKNATTPTSPRYTEFISNLSSIDEDKDNQIEELTQKYMASFMERDTDNSNSVSWEEFLAYESRNVICNRDQKSMRRMKRSATMTPRRKKPLVLKRKRFSTGFITPVL